MHSQALFYYFDIACNMSVFLGMSSLENTLLGPKYIHSHCMTPVVSDSSTYPEAQDDK